MLRGLGYLSGILVIGGLLATGGYWAYQTWPSGGAEEAIPQGHARTTTAYQLARQDWTDFPLPRPTPKVRLLVHADLPAAAVSPERSEPVRFAVAVQGLNEAGEVVFERRHHFRTGVALYRTPEGQIQSGKAYADAAIVPTASQLTVLSLPEPGQVDRLRLRTTAAKGAVSAVAARLYIPERLSGAKVAARWPRLSADQRARLADGNVYPPALLSRSERARLSAVRWHRIGPAGLAGRDYTERTLYIRDNPEAEPVAPPVAPQGVRVGPNRRATVKLPEAETDLAMQFTALEAPAGQARVRLYTDQPGVTRRVTAPWQAKKVRIQGNWQGRMLELQSDVPAVVRVVPQGRGQEGGPTAKPAVLRTVQAAAEPRWAVRHVDGRPSPFRLDLRCRCFGADGQPVAAGSATVALLDDQGAVLERHDVLVDEPLSRYDQLRGDEGSRLLSERRRLYFRLPSEVAAVRVTGSKQVYAAAFNRPNGLRRTVRVPEDRFAAQGAALRDRRSWFYLPPDDESLGPKATSLVAIQGRPPKVDPRIAAGDYDWQAYRPAGSWAARRILLPKEGAGAVRPEALGSTYTPLAIGEPQRLRIDAAAPRAVRPNLVFAGNQGRSSLRVRVDGERILERNLVAASGRLKLPAVERGRHRIQLETESSARFYLSHVAGAERRWGLTLANRLQPGTTQFRYEKTTADAELLSFRFYPVLPSADRRVIDVTVGEGRVAGLRPYADLTLPRRRYDVRVDASTGFPVLGATDTIGEARRFFLELGADLPPGTYPIRIHLRGEGEGYFRLATTTPGRSEARGVRRQGADDAQ